MKVKGGMAGRKMCCFKNLHAMQGQCGLCFVRIRNLKALLSQQSF